MTLDNAFANCQSDARSRVAVVVVFHALENAKDVFMIVFADSDPVIADADSPVLIVSLASNVNPGCLVAGVFDRVVHQVLKKLHKLTFYREQRW